MGYKRQQERKRRHAAGEFDEKKIMQVIERSAIQRTAFNTRIFYTLPPSGNIQVEWYGGTSSIRSRRERFDTMYPDARIACVKSGPCKRWHKPEHPIARRRRLREEEFQRQTKTV